MYLPIDSTYLIPMLLALAFSFWAQHMVQSNFKKFSKVPTMRGMTGADAARQILLDAGVTNVRVERVAGNLTDHFDPRENVIRLSEAVHDAPTVAAVGVAAHEAGHALQYANAYFPMKIRAAIIPVTNIGSKLSIPLVVIGLAIEMTGLINIGVLLFCAVVLFQLATLPVEFNASNRAIRILGETGILYDDELSGAKKVLTAAAMTYVAALINAVIQLLRLLSLANRRRR